MFCRVGSEVLGKLVSPDEVLVATRARNGTVYVGDRGSKLRIAQWVNARPAQLSRTLLGASRTLVDFVGDRMLKWRSPLAASDFYEFSADFWDELELPLPRPFDTGFWPTRQPHWDALAVADGAFGKGVVLVEAKSHLGEVRSRCAARDEKSLDTITRSLDDAKRYLGVPETTDWLQPHYQAANRLAFLYYMRAQRNIPTWLFFVYFLRDTLEVGGIPRECPEGEDGWKPTLADMKSALGLPPSHPLEHFVADAFLVADPG